MSRSAVVSRRWNRSREEPVALDLEKKVTAGGQAQRDVGRKSYSKIIVSILAFQFLALQYSVIWIGNTSGKLRIHLFPPKPKRNPLELKNASQSRVPQFVRLPPPPWLKHSNHGEISPKRLFMMQGIYDMHFFNGLSPPFEFAKSMAQEFRNEADSDRVPRRYDRPNQRFEIVYCVGCAPVDGNKWVSAISSSGLSLAALATMNADNSASLQFESLEVTTTDRWSHLDIGVPCGCQHAERLPVFAEMLSNAIKSIRIRVCVRLLITRYSCDAKSPKYLSVKEIESLSGLKERRLEKDDTMTDLDRAIYLKFQEANFSKDRAIESIHGITDHSNKRSLLIMIDMDTYMDIQFVYNAMAFVSRGVSAYFPILWMAYHPQNIKDAFAFRETRENGLFDNDQGVWRTSGFSVYAMASADAAKIAVKKATKFEGWGAEGCDVFTRPVLEYLHIIRKLERGLIHMWHPTYCPSRFSIRRDCIRSVAFAEGPLLANHVRLYPNRFPGGNLAVSASARLMIAVTTSKMAFAQRFPANDATWANKGKLPRQVFVRYFVGKQGKPFSTKNGEGESFMKKQLALQVGLFQKDAIFDPDESIVILRDVGDIEDPPRNKNPAVLKHIAQSAASSGPGRIGWIMVVNDHTLVNTAGLMRLIAHFNEKVPVILGPTRLGRGSEEIEVADSAYCLLSSAYVMPYVTLKKIVKEQDKCIRDGDALRPKSLGKKIWRSTVIDMCMEKVSLRIVGCKQDTPDYEASKLFRHNHDMHSHISKQDIKNIVAVHPVENIEDMQVIFKRFTGEREEFLWLD